MSSVKNIAKGFFIGETKIEKMLSLATFVFLILLIATGGYWIMTRQYNKYLIGLVNILVLFAGTLGLRVKTINEKEEAKKNAENSYEKMGLSLEEATEYFLSRMRNRILREWINLLIGTTLISICIIVLFPV